MNQLEFYKSLPNIPEDLICKINKIIPPLDYGNKTTQEVNRKSQEFLSSSTPIATSTKPIPISPTYNDNNTLKVPNFSFSLSNKRRRSVSLYVNNKQLDKKNLDAKSKFKITSTSNISVSKRDTTEKIKLDTFKRSDQNQNIGNSKIVFKKHSSPTSSTSSTDLDTIKQKSNLNVKTLKQEDLDSGLCSSNEDTKSSQHHLDDEDKHYLHSDILFQFDLNETHHKKNDLPNVFKNRALFSLRRSFNRLKLDCSSNDSTNNNNNNNVYTQSDEVSIGKRKQRNQLNNRFAAEMPSLLEQSEQLNEQMGSKKINILINECSNNEESTSQLQTPQQQQNITADFASSISNLAESANKPANLLTSLEYFINSKTNLMNTKQAIANIAAVAAIHDSNENINIQQNHTASKEITINNNANTAQTSSNNNSLNEYFLHSLFMDISSHNNQIGISTQSQLDLSSTASVEPNDMSFLYQSQLNNNQNFNIVNDNINSINLLQISSHAGSGNNMANASNKISCEFNSNFNNSFNNNTMSNSLNTKKQINDHIMRTCMGYLDFINKKHNRERRLQTIRNKISGFVLLMLVFLMVLSLAMVMTYSLTRELTKIITNKSNSRLDSIEYKNNTIINIQQNNTINQKNDFNLTKKNDFQTLTKYSQAFYRMAQMIKLREKFNNNSSSFLLPINKNKNSSNLGDSDSNNISLNDENIVKDLIQETEKIIKIEIKLFTENLILKLSSIVKNKNELNLDRKKERMQTELYDLIVNILDDDSQSDNSNNDIEKQALFYYYRFIDELNY